KDNQIFIPDESIFAAIAPENPRMDPTDRSIPDVNITKVIPAAIIALMEVCLNTFNRFAVVKNFGLIILIIMENIMRPIKGLTLFNFSFISIYIYSSLTI